MKLATLLLLLVAACKSSSAPSVCDKYGDMEAKCNVVPGNSADDNRAIAGAMCREAQKNAPTSLIAREAACASTTTDCAAYTACTEKAETTP